MTKVPIAVDFMETVVLFVLQLIILIFAQFLCLSMYRALILFFLISGMCFGQDQNVLLTINDEQIKTEEFLNSYKKNREIIAASQKTSIVEYLQLFIDYKLKVQEAVKLGYADDSAYKKELKTYRDQLAQKFIKNTKVTDTLVNEAYSRIVNEVNARHILVQVEDGTDTLTAYNRILNARQRIVGGEDFNKVARETSDDPSVKTNGGELGWFGAFKMVYPFENAAYRTEVSKISMPFRTEFGYHIVEPTATRKSLGIIQVAHIMIAHEQPDSLLAAEQKIEQIHNRLESGEDFSVLAKAYSDDKSSSIKGGVLPTFNQGQLRSRVFEKEAFSLNSIGEYTQPFRTDFGWHVIRLLKKEPIKPLEELKEELTQRVTRDARSRIIDQTLSNKLRQRYVVNDHEKLISFFEIIFKSDTQSLSDEDAQKIAITIHKRKYTYGQVFNYLQGKLKRTKKMGVGNTSFVRREINYWIDTALKEYYLETLEYEDSDFQMMLREFKEGLLLFNFLQKKVWEAAATDSTGLKSYFDNHKAQYESKSLEDVKGKVMSEYQKNLEATMVEKLRNKATIKIEEKILAQMLTAHDN